MCRGSVRRNATRPCIAICWRRANNAHSAFFVIPAFAGITIHEDSIVCMKQRVSPGSPESLGVTPTDSGVNVAVFSAHASAIEFCLFDVQGDAEVERISLTERSGDIFHAHIADVGTGVRYGLRAHGPYAPREGHRFNPAKLLVDPYALQLDRPFALHAAVFGFAGGDPNSADHRDEADSASVVPKAIVTARADLYTKWTAVRIPW